MKMKKGLVDLYLFLVTIFILLSACNIVRKFRDTEQRSISVPCRTIDPLPPRCPLEPVASTMVTPNTLEFDNKDRFKTSCFGRSQILLLLYPDPLSKTSQGFGFHSFDNEFDFSLSSPFDSKNWISTPLLDIQASDEENEISPLDFNVAPIEINTTLINDYTFIKAPNGIPPWLEKCRFERTIVSRLNPSGDPSFIVYFGIKKSGKYGSSALPKTGVVWKIANLKNKQ